MPAYLMPMLFYMLCKMFNNFSGQHSYQICLPPHIEHVWNNTLHVLFAHLLSIWTIICMWHYDWNTRIGARFLSQPQGFSCFMTSNKICEVWSSKQSTTWPKEEVNKWKCLASSISGCWSVLTVTVWIACVLIHSWLGTYSFLDWVVPMLPIQAASCALLYWDGCSW